MAEKVDKTSSDDVASQFQAPAAGVDETASGAPPPGDKSLAEKQAMVEKLFRHTNVFLAENRDDPLLVVESLAAIVVRYAALLGPVEQMPARLTVLQALIGQECQQVEALAKAAEWEKKGGAA